jgi:8-oxo-dGDP phosphatase
MQDPATALQPWIVKSSRRVLDDKWLKIRADTCETAAGVEVTPYFVLEYPDWVHIVAIDDRDHIILVEQYRHGLGRICLELPAGGIDPSDPDPLAAGRRELREETGYAADDWRLVAKLSPNPSNQDNFCHVVLATGAILQGETLNDPTEEIRVVRVPVAEAVSLALEGKLIQAMHVANLFLGLHAAGRLQLSLVA